jgi:hypothetical protein
VRPQLRKRDRELAELRAELAELRHEIDLTKRLDEIDARLNRIEAVPACAAWLGDSFAGAPVILSRRKRGRWRCPCRPGASFVLIHQRAYFCERDAARARRAHVCAFSHFVALSRGMTALSDLGRSLKHGSTQR